MDRALNVTGILKTPSKEHPPHPLKDCSACSKLLFARSFLSYSTAVTAFSVIIMHLYKLYYRSKLAAYLKHPEFNNCMFFLYENYRNRVEVFMREKSQTLEFSNRLILYMWLMLRGVSYAEWTLRFKTWEFAFEQCWIWAELYIQLEKSLVNEGTRDSSLLFE